jgi:hypothetical protein
LKIMSVKIRVAAVLATAVGALLFHAAPANAKDGGDDSGGGGVNIPICVDVLETDACSNVGTEGRDQDPGGRAPEDAVAV